MYNCTVPSCTIAFSYKVILRISCQPGCLSPLIRAPDTGKAPLGAELGTQRRHLRNMIPSRERWCSDLCYLWHWTLIMRGMQTMTQSCNQSNTLHIPHSPHCDWCCNVVISSPGLNRKTKKNSEQVQSSLIPAQAIIGVKFLLGTLLWC